MKKYFLAGMMLLPLALFSQNLFPDGNAVWNIHHEEQGNILGPPINTPNGMMVNVINGTLEFDFRYALTHDTVLNGFTWKTLHQNGQSTFTSWDGDTTFINPITSIERGAIREDGSKVWYFRFYDLTTYLLYDYDLQVGDTLPYSYINTFQNITVSQIDTMYINGIAHRKYVLAGNGIVNDTIIEGVGHVKGLIEHLGIGFDSFDLLTCFQQDGQTHYPENAEPCEPFTVNINPVFQTSNNISVYPNPSNGEFSLQPSDQLPFHYRVFDAQGRQVMGGNSQGLTNINANHLKRGIYFVLISDEKGNEIQSRKVVLN